MRFMCEGRGGGGWIAYMGWYEGGRVVAAWCMN